MQGAGCGGREELWMGGPGLKAPKKNENKAKPCLPRVNLETVVH